MKCKYCNKELKEKPICAVKGCKRTALVLFGGKWICGECLVAYDNRMKEKQFADLQEALGNDNNDMS